MSRKIPDFIIISSPKFSKPPSFLSAEGFVAGVYAIRKGSGQPIGSLTQMGTIRLGKRMDKPIPMIRDFYHKVRINYYPPRGDNKEGWDNIDIFGWLGYPMQLKVDILCRDSILAAPLVEALITHLGLEYYD